MAPHSDNDGGAAGLGIMSAAHEVGVISPPHGLNVSSLALAKKEVLCNSNHIVNSD